MVADRRLANGAGVTGLVTSPGSRQNRVTPFGEILSTTARGTLMGNRGGCLHDDRGRLAVARWRSRRWIACLLDFKGRHRTVMAPGRYTELFFLDEATALAAGHRPCAECRRDAFRRFKAAWLRGNGDRAVDPRASIDEIDRHLQRERVDGGRQKISFRATIDSLPDGAFVALDESPSEAHLLRGLRLYRWSVEGYTGHRARPTGVDVRVLTPRSVVSAMAAGYAPTVHPSLTAGL